MRTTIQIANTLLLLLLLSGAEFAASDQRVEPDKFFREHVGLKDDQIQAIRRGKALAKVMESRTPR